MLNELYHLSIALERAGIMPVDWYKDLKPPAKYLSKETMLPDLNQPRWFNCRR